MCGRRPRSVSPLLIVVVAVSAVAASRCAGTPPASPRLEARRVPSPAVLPVAVRVRVNGVIVAVPLEEYAAASALSEVTPIDETPETVAGMFDVQTVLARSYAVANLGRHGRDGFDLCDGTHCQLYQPARLDTSRFASAARSAAARTAGRILTFGERPARVLFHADCGGHTASADSIWTGRPLAYLAGNPDEAPDLKHRTWTFTLTPAQLQTALATAGRVPRGSIFTTVTVTDRDGSGRATRLVIGGRERVVIDGEAFRSAINHTHGPRSIQSTRFSVADTGGRLVFTGSGFGHGVGLCQVGALARVRRGDTAEEVLDTYFPGAHLSPSVEPAPLPTRPVPVLPLRPHPFPPPANSARSRG